MLVNSLVRSPRSHIPLVLTARSLAHSLEKGIFPCIECVHLIQFQPTKQPCHIEFLQHRKKKNKLGRWRWRWDGNDQNINHAARQPRRSDKIGIANIVEVQGPDTFSPSRFRAVDVKGSDGCKFKVDCKFVTPVSSRCKAQPRVLSSLRHVF